MYTLEEIKHLAPSIFTIDKAPHLTEQYIQTPTSRVIEDLIKLGWQIIKVSEVKARKGIGFQKHMVVFRNPDIKIEDNKIFPQILLTNSHNGKAAFNFRVGLFRLVCSNGLVISDADFNNISIRHVNYTFETLHKTITEIIDKIPNLVNKVNQFKIIKLSELKQLDFAKRASELRSKNIDYSLLLKPSRIEDTGNSLWTTFNTIQEKLINGNYNYGPKNRRARSIKNFQQDIKLNEQLWKLAENYIN